MHLSDLFSFAEPLLGDQVSIRLLQDALSRVSKEHSATDHTVCTEQFMDDGEANLGRQWMSASKTGRMHSVKVGIA